MVEKLVEKSEFRQYIHLPRKLVKPINTLFEGRKYGFVHIISLTKSALYAIPKKNIVPFKIEKKTITV